MARTSSFATGRRRGEAAGAPWARSCWSTASASIPAATNTSATRWRRPASTSTPTTCAGTVDRAGRRGHVDRWEQLHDDLAERVAAVRAVAGTRPVVLYGHSMGGLIVLGYLLQPSAQCRTWWSSRRRVSIRRSPRGRSRSRRPCRGSRRRWPSRTASIGSTLSRDPAVAASRRRRPANAAKASTARFAAEGLTEQARCRRDYAGLTLPTLVLHGLDDGLVPPEASEILGHAPERGAADLPGLRHELHNEPEGPAIVDEIIDWIRARTAVRATIPA